MKASVLAESLANLEPDAEVFLALEDGFEHDFEIIERPEVFDGFDTAYPAGISLKPIN